MERGKSLHASTRIGVFALFAWLVAVPGCQQRRALDREIWAEVDGQPIYRDQVERVYRSRAATGADASSPQETLSFELSMLNELINNQILIEHASRAGISVSEAEVDTRVAQLQSPYSKEEFQKKLNDQGLEMADLRQQVHQDIVLTKLINKEIDSRISVSDAEIAGYYERNQSNFKVPETQYHLAQIEVSSTGTPEARNLKDREAKTLGMARKIQALYARLLAGEDFAALARQYSEDPKTGEGGGDMGFIPASALNANPQLKQAVAALKVNQFSRILRDRNGYHIVKLLGREEGGLHPLSDVRVQNAIRQTLRNEKEQLLKAAYIEDLRNRAKVVNYLAAQILKGEASASASK
jgi:peptidyl-prolyl cis-trans isomerase SurA